MEQTLEQAAEAYAEEEVCMEKHRGYRNALIYAFHAGAEYWRRVHE